jgi:hypothetical protein
LGKQVDPEWVKQVLDYKRSRSGDPVAEIARDARTKAHLFAYAATRPYFDPDKPTTMEVLARLLRNAFCVISDPAEKKKKPKQPTWVQEKIWSNEALVFASPQTHRMVFYPEVVPHVHLTNFLAARFTSAPICKNDRDVEFYVSQMTLDLRCQYSISKATFVKFHADREAGAQEAMWARDI